ncbi:MAG: glycosyltransferase family 4 protein [Phycisphaerales bacterium JB059]
MTTAIPTIGEATTQVVPDGVANRIESLGAQIQSLAARQQELADLAGIAGKPEWSRMEIFQGYLAIGVVAFVITLLTTPIIRRLAIANGVVDHPDERKMHRMPIAYLGGLAVYLGLMGAIFFSYIATDPRFGSLITFHQTEHLYDGGFPRAVPPWIPLGITVIMLVGLLDDVIGIPPRVKIGGQLFAAAALAYGDIGVKVAQGVLAPTIGKLIGNQELTWIFDLGAEWPLIGSHLEVDLIYWAGTAVIAVFVLGACNAANLIDGLDGLLSGTTAITAAGLLVVALGLAMVDYGSLDASRIILCMALLGACLGFLPHNFNPATIFLGDCGSLLLGFTTIVIVLTLGDLGQTFLVLAGLVIFALPIIDTILAIVRRKMAGKKMSDPDSDHLHHMLKRTLGVKGAVLTLYGFAALFAVLGILISETKARFVYALALITISYITVYAIKIARKATIEKQSRELMEAAAKGARPTPGEPESALEAEAANA